MKSTTTMPSNDGVLIRVTPFASTDYQPKSPEAPGGGVVERLGGGVPWLTPGTQVSYDVTRATLIDYDFVLVHQRAILATHVPEDVRECAPYPG